MRTALQAIIDLLFSVFSVLSLWLRYQIISDLHVFLTDV